MHGFTSSRGIRFFAIHGMLVAALALSRSTKAEDTPSPKGKSNPPRRSIFDDPDLPPSTPEGTAKPKPAKANDAPSSAPHDMQGHHPGLICELFADMEMTRKLKTRIDRQVYFAWKKDPPDAAVTDKENRFAIRWSGLLRVTRAGNYLLTYSLDDAVRIFIDDKQVVMTGGPTHLDGQEVKLTAGFHPLRIEYMNFAFEAWFLPQWSFEGGPPELLPRDAFWHDAEPTDAALPEPGWCSELMAGYFGIHSFREHAPAGSVLVGLEYSINNDYDRERIRSVRAIYRGASGESMGKIYGKPTDHIERAVARSGFAVGSMNAFASEYWLWGVTLHCMRVTPKGLTPEDAYDIPYAGTPTSIRHTIGENHTLIGIHGVYDDDNLTGFGVISGE